MATLKRLIRNSWMVILLVTAVASIVATFWVLIAERDVSDAVALAALAALLVGVALLLARTRSLQKRLTTLLRSQAAGDTSDLDLEWAADAAVEPTRELLRHAEPDDAATLLRTLSELRQDEDLRHSEMRALAEELRAAQTAIGRRLDRIESRLGAPGSPDGPQLGELP